MSSSQPLDIKVIYSASKRPARAGRPAHEVRPTVTPVAAHAAPTVRSTTVAAAPARRAWLLLAVFNLAVVGGLYYGTWWVGDKFITFKMMLHMPIEGMDASAVDQYFPGAAPDPIADLELAQAAEESAPRFTGNTAVAVLVGSGYGWLTLSTISLCLLAVGTGTAFGKLTGSRLRRIAVILFAGGTLWLAYLTYSLSLEYGWGYKSNHLRIGMGCLILWFALLGCAIDRGHRRCTRLGAHALIVAAAGTVTALFLGHQCGAIEEEWATPLVLVGAFAAHSLYGWILLPATARLRA